MHILMTDVMTCPRCGPAFGLILLADRVTERRVESGVLGCANCREQYPIRGGTARFTEASAERAADAAGATDMERLAALIGIAQGPATILIAGPAAEGAAAVAAMLDNVEVAAIGGGAAGAAGTGGVSRIDAADRLPLASGRMAGVALTGAAAARLLEEGARVASVTGRLVLEPAPADAAQRLERAGMRIIAQERDTVVAVR
jgi:uncharacterized protein YbaR (Trm112 family)